MKVLNDPRGPLSKLPADTFTIINANGSKPAFTGIRVKYVPQTAVAQNAFTVLAPGQLVQVEHDCSYFTYIFSSTIADNFQQYLRRIISHSLEQARTASKLATSSVLSTMPTRLHVCMPMRRHTTPTSTEHLQHPVTRPIFLKAPNSTDVLPPKK